MITNETILAKIAEMNDFNFVLATVVSVEGSAYRREGAKMLINGNGDTFGLISGGCLEADVVEVAKKVFDDGKSIVKRYALDENLVWGLGLGCPGNVEILIERISVTSSYYKNWASIIMKGTPHIVCKVLPIDYLSPESLLVTEKNIYGCRKEERFQRDIAMFARKKLSERNPKSETVILPGFGEVFFDVYSPPPLICIFGAGHDAIPVAQLAHTLGFQTLIVDGRPAFNTEERFPRAKRLVKHAFELEQTDFINHDTYIIIMNHHLERDMDSIAFALRSKSPYVGLLGPRKRREKMFVAFREQGEFFSMEQLEKMHNPIGLNIGADSPEEIALSIMAEIVAFRRGYDGSSLRNSFSIHSHPTPEGIR